MKTIRILTLAALLAAGLASTPMAQQVQTVSIPLTDPGRPVELSTSLLSGSISVEGYSGDQVVIEILPEEMEPATDERTKGMRRIPNTSLGLSAEEESNRVEVHGNWASRISKLTIKVPHRTSAGLSCTNDCDITIEGLEGDMELSNVNGSITVLDVSGSVVANTTNGDVKVTFDRMDRDKAMSFVTFNGDVDVTFPSNLSANLQVGTTQGDIYTDFDFELKPQRPHVDKGREGGRYRVELKSEVYAQVGGGGVELRFETWNGDIFIRRAGG